MKYYCTLKYYAVLKLDGEEAAKIVGRAHLVWLEIDKLYDEYEKLRKIKKKI